MGSMEAFMKVADVFVVPAILLLLGWIGKISGELTALRVLLAERYVPRDVMERTILPVREDVDYLKRLIIRICDKMHVSVE